MPAEHMLQGAATYPALAGSHAAAASQFGLTPVSVPGQRRVGHVFAATHQRVGLRQRFELRFESERSVEGVGKILPARAARQPLAGACNIADRRVAHNRALDQSKFTVTETGALTRCVVIGANGCLPGIDGKCLTIELATEDLAELGVVNQTEATRQAIAGQFDDFSLLLQAYPFQSFNT